MNIHTIISKEATEKYADSYLAYNYYEKTVKRLEENARNGYKVLCEYFNGSTTKQVLAMMYELKLTERQNGMVVI